eukprot:5682752-Pleurochrysis_carterae.AAC.1
MPSVEGCPGILCPYNIPLGGSGLCLDRVSCAPVPPSPTVLMSGLGGCWGWERGESAAAGCSPA